MIPQLKSIFNQNQLTQLVNLLTQRVNGLIGGKEDVANKQDSLAADGTGVKYPTVDAINNEVTLDKVLTIGNLSEQDAGVKTLKLFDEPNGSYGEVSINDSVFEVINSDGQAFISQEGGEITFYTKASLSFSSVTTNKTFTLPDKNGTFAMLDDVTTAESAANSYTDGEVATKQNLFDYSGSASGTTAVTIDDLSGGVAEFTQVIVRKTTQSFRINSNIIEATSKIIPVLVYDGAGYPVILSQKLAAGRVDFLVANLDVLTTGGTDTDASIFIEYQIVG